MRKLLLEPYDQLLHLHRKLVGVSIGTPTAVRQPLDGEQEKLYEYIEPFLWQWETFVVSPITREVMVEFTIDPELPERQREYLLNYDKYGIIEHLEITAAPLDYGD